MNGTEDRVATRGGAWFASIVAALVVLVLAVLIVLEWAPLLAADDTVAVAVHRWALETPWAVDVAQRFDVIGGFRVSAVVAAVTVVILLVARRRWTALMVAVVALASSGAVEVIKDVVERPRPAWAIELGAETGWSFPSGHAAGGIAVWCVCGVALASLIRDPSWGALFALPWILLGITIGLSRVVLGVHWPSDVVGGWAVAIAVIGAASALLVIPAARVDQRRLPVGSAAEPRLR